MSGALSSIMGGGGGSSGGGWMDLLPPRAAPPEAPPTPDQVSLPNAPTPPAQAGDVPRRSQWDVSSAGDNWRGPRQPQGQMATLLTGGMGVTEKLKTSKSRLTGG